MEANARMNSLVKNKWVRGVAWTVLGVLVLWALGWLALPPIAKSQAQKIASEQLGRKVTIGAVEFKPWTLELTVRDVVVASADGSFEQAHVKRLYADAELQSLLRFAPVVDAVTVDGVALKLTHLGGGKYDIDDILQRLAKPSDKPKSDEPARFALYNLSLNGASLDYADKAVTRTHELRDLTLTVPFLSSLEAQRDVNVEPRLAFTLNGSRFDSAAQSTPFAQSRKTDATLSFKNLDLAPYLGYLPASLPVKLLSAIVDADVKVNFERSPAVAVKLSGTVKTRDLKVVDAAGGDLLSLAQLNVVATDVQPLARIAKVASVEVVAPKLVVRRDAAGRLNVAMGAGSTGTSSSSSSSSSSSAQAQPQAQAASAVAATSPSAPASASASAPTSAPTSTTAASASAPTASATASSEPTKPWAVEIAKVSVREGTIGWTDQTLSAAAPVNVRDIVLDASQIVLPFAKPLAFSGSAALDAPHNGQLKFNGQATDKAASVETTVDAVSLDVAAPYLSALMEPTLAGQLSAAFKLDWAANGALTVDAKTVSLDGLALTSAFDTGSDITDEIAANRAAVASRTAPPAARAAGQRNAAARTAAGRTAPATQPAARAANEPNTAPNALGARLPRGTLASLKQFQLTDAHVDLAAQRVTIGRLALSEPRARVNRFADKHWMYEQWLRAPIAASPSNATSADPKTRPQHATGAPANPTAKPWSVAVSDIAIDGGAISYADLSGAKPVRFSVSDIALGLKNFSPDATQPSPITVLARISARRGEPGTASFKGTLGLAPMAAAGQIELTRLPLHAFEPYFAAGLNVELQRADTSFIGKASFQAGPNGPTLNVAGNGQVDNFRANSNPDSASASAKTGTLDAATAAAAGASAAPASVAQAGAARANTTTARTAAAAATRPPTTTTTTARNERPSPTGSVASTLQGDAALAEELLSWKALNLRGVAVAMKPGTRTTVDVKETALSDFFARLIVKEDGRINLQDLVKSDPAPAPAANGASAAATSTTASANAPLIRFGPISLVNGRVLFSDRFIKPNYSASLSELTGKLSAFSSASPDGQPQLADLELRGRAEGTASLEITGKLNPLAKPLALDITGKVRDLELPPLSPYSVKYAGYGIERGKMSVDVNYVVQPDGQLTAKNKLVLNQLTFGDKVEGAPNSLPVKLAVALLADRNGVIDLDLPISGSLNDPQFSLFPVILKVIGNVIVKAITSPFSLLAGAFGGGGTGGEGLDGVTFAPGSTALDGSARTTLDKVAKALTERPALKLTVTGSANVDAEREAYKRERLMQLVQAEKRRLTSDGGSSSAPKPAANVASAARASASAASAVDVSPAEYPELLKSVYKSAEISKPRNLIGLAKDLPTAEMESLLLANINVTDESIRELAVERGVAVRDYLASRELPLDRLFLGAAKAQAAPATAGTEQKFTPRAELSLATQ